MPDPITFSNNLKKSADDFLTKHSVISTLSKLGEVQLVGSYLYNLMTWQNLDILIVNKTLSKEAFYDLCQYFLKEFNVKSANFEDKSIKTAESQPTGYRWEILTDDNWTLDIWYIDQNEALVQEQVRNEIYGGLDDNKRRLILTLKLDPEYRISYNAFDVYMAVLQDNVTSIKDFQNWLSRK